LKAGASGRKNCIEAIFLPQNKNFPQKNQRPRSAYMPPNTIEKEGL